MDAKVARLEANFEHMDKTMDEMKTDLKMVIGKLGDLNEKVAKLPTRDNLMTYFTASLALAFAVIAIVIGGVIGGLGWLQHH